MKNDYTMEHVEGNGFKTSVMANPVIRKLGRVTETAAEGEAATYTGIGIKTLFFILMTIGGVAAFYIMHNLYAAQALQDGITLGDATFAYQELMIFLGAAIITLIVPIIAWLIRPTIPVTGTLYSMTQGFVIAFSANLYGGEYKELVWEALGLTVIIVVTMAVLYMTGIVKVGRKFNAVIKVLFLTSVLGGLGGFILWIIPATREFVTVLMANPVLSIGGGLLMVIIAALFLLSDFDAIEKTVENELPKKYEWAAAYGLVFTVIWLYFKVLNLLLRIRNLSRD